MSRPNPHNSLLRTPEQPERSVPQLVEASPFTLFTKQLPPITPPRSYGASNFSLPLSSPFSPGSLLLTSPMLLPVFGVGYPEQYLREYTGAPDQQLPTAQTPGNRDSGLESDKQPSNTFFNSWQLPSPNVPLFVPSPRKSPRLLTKTKVCSTNPVSESQDDRCAFEPAASTRESSAFANVKLEPQEDNQAIPNPNLLSKLPLSSNLPRATSLYGNGFGGHTETGGTKTFRTAGRTQDQDAKDTLLQQAEQFVTHMRKRSARRKLLPDVPDSPVKSQRLMSDKLYTKRTRVSDPDDELPAKPFKIRREQSYTADYPSYSNRRRAGSHIVDRSESSRPYLAPAQDAHVKVKQEFEHERRTANRREQAGFKCKGETSSNFAAASEGDFPSSVHRSKETASGYTDSDSAQYSSEQHGSPYAAKTVSFGTSEEVLPRKENRLSRMAELAAASVRRPSKRLGGMQQHPPSPPTPLEGHNKPVTASNSDGSEDNGQKRCSCKRSKCLKLYCDCFAAGSFCNDNCGCVDCENTYDNRDLVEDKRGAIKQRNPQAFQGKIVKSEAFGTHVRGCNCKKSHCRKKYCECFQGGVACGDACKCVGCQNTVAHGAKPAKPSRSSDTVS